MQSVSESYLLFEDDNDDDDQIVTNVAQSEDCKDT